MLDVIIAGAGPAGSVAATLLARAGARVLIVDRETFPRDKLCGDTLNPGVVKLLQSIDLWGGPLASAPPLAGMVLSGPTERVEGRYGDGLAGRAITRRALDAWLLDQAIAAGARFEAGEIVRGPLVDSSHGVTVVRGLVLARRGQHSQTTRVPAAMTLAADGRRSVLARALGLSRHPKRPRRRRNAHPAGRLSGYCASRRGTRERVRGDRTRAGGPQAGGRRASGDRARSGDRREVCARDVRQPRERPRPPRG